MRRSQDGRPHEAKIDTGELGLGGARSAPGIDNCWMQ